MASSIRALRRSVIAAGRRVRELSMIARGLASTEQALMAHIIPIRRCNLSCAYCNEYDAVSRPVPLPLLEERIDHLRRLGVMVVTISGGEPLLHPQLDDLISYIRQRGALAGLITNGYLLTAERIQRFNRAGLDHMQISIDNVMPDEVSKKSLKVLDRKLQLLAEHADFHVNINSVIGGGIRHPHDALVVARRARQLGFTSTVGIIHDGDGQQRPLSEKELDVFAKIKRMSRRNYSRFNRFQDNIALGRPNQWRCRAGARYLYICEDGLVHYCSQQRGFPAKPLAEYTLEDVRREFHTEKRCAPHCTVSCVHIISAIDAWRAPQQAEQGCPQGVEAVRDIERSHMPGTPIPQPTRRPSARPASELVQINTRPVTE